PCPRGSPPLPTRRSSDLQGCSARVTGTQVGPRAVETLPVLPEVDAHRLQGSRRTGGADRGKCHHSITEAIVEVVRPGKIVSLRLDRKSTRLNSSHEWISY